MKLIVSLFAVGLLYSYSSFSNSNSYNATTGTIVVGSGESGSSQIPHYPVCADGRTDTVGEGWGWQNGGSCVVTERSSYSHTTKSWNSCSANARVRGKFGVEKNGGRCVITNDSLGFSVEVFTMGDFNDGSWGGGYVAMLAQSNSDEATAIDRDRSDDIDEAAVAGAVDPDPVLPGVVEPVIDTETSIVDVDTGSPLLSYDRPTTWSDSYSVDGQCYCDSTFDHGIADVEISTNDGSKTVRRICADVSAKYGQGEGLGREYYNSVQCGHPPLNDAGDEQLCSGQPLAQGQWSGPGCGNTGDTWNLDVIYPDSVVVGPDEVVGDWWKPRASDKLTWYMQFSGELNTMIDADVYFIDSDVDQSLINELLSRDKKLMCYISAGSWEEWRDDLNLIPNSVIGYDYDGWPGEKWLDISKTELLEPLIRSRIEKCQRKGFHGIDADNVNAYANGTGFNLTRDDGIYYVKWLANLSHSMGMAFSLKNSEDIVVQVVDDVDMLQSESCDFWNNCGPGLVMIDQNKPVWMVEYEGINPNWDRACQRAVGYGYSAIFRDFALTENGVFRMCEN